MDESKSEILLGIVSMCGEITSDVFEIVIPSAEYRKKVLMGLKKNNLIYKYSDVPLPSYRLTKTGKKRLLLINEERYGFFLTGTADESMRTSILTRRKRQHNLGAVMACMINGGINIFRDEKKKFGEVQNTAFLTAMELKEKNDLWIKVRNSRMLGVIINSNDIWSVYNVSNGVFRWYDNVELRLRILLSQVSRDSDNINALVFGNSIDAVKYFLSENGKKVSILNSTFNKFSFIPLDRNGEVQLKVMLNEEIYNNFLRIASNGNIKDTIFNIEHDWVENGVPVLLAVDFDIKRILNFIKEINYNGINGKIVCFDFQKEVIDVYCGENISFTPISAEKFRQAFLN